MPQFRVYIDGMIKGEIECADREQALEKVAGWNGIMVEELDDESSS